MASSFKMQETYTKSKLDFLFKDNPIKDVDRINCARLRKSLRPRTWKDRIPFGVCIDKTQNKAYFLYYKSFFQKAIIPIDNNSFSNLEDICVNDKGLIFVADSDRDSIFCFLLNKDLKSTTLKYIIPIKKPLRCEIIGNKEIAVLTQENKIVIFKTYQNKYIKKENISKKINSYFQKEKFIDISISTYKQTHVYVLSDKAIFKFDNSGNLLKSKDINSHYIAIENSYFGDLFLLSQSKNELIKYSGDLIELDQLIFPEEFNNRIQDITIYDSFGYLFLAGKETGLYYGLGVELKDYKISKKKKSSGGFFYTIDFLTTLSSIVSVEIEDDKGAALHTLLKEKKVPSGPHSIYLDENAFSIKSITSPLFVKVVAKARYSLSNTVTKKNILYYNEI
jgi:hypothetical protein